MGHETNSHLAHQTIHGSFASLARTSGHLGSDAGPLFLRGFGPGMAGFGAEGQSGEGSGGHAGQAGTYHSQVEDEKEVQDPGFRRIDELWV